MHYIQYICLFMTKYYKPTNKSKQYTRMIMLIA